MKKKSNFPFKLYSENNIRKKEKTAAKYKGDI